MVRQTKCRCQTVVDIPDDTPAGSCVNCPDCGELLEVPSHSSEQPFAYDPDPSKEPLENAPLTDHLSDRDSHTKIFMIFGLAILLIVIFTAIMLKLAESTGIDAEGWDIVPEDVTVIGMVNMDAALRVPVIRYAAESLEDNPDARALQGMGVALTNIRHIYIAVPEAGFGAARADPMMLLQSKKSMDAESIIETLQADRQLGEREDIAGLTGYHLARSEFENPAMMLFVSNDLLAFGSPDMVRETGRLAAGESDRSVRRNSRIVEMSRKTSARDLLWFAALVPEGAEDEYLGSPETALILGNYIMEQGLQLEAKLNYADADQAESVARQIQPMLGMIAMMFGLEQENIALRADGRDVEITALVPPKILTALLGGEGL